nr:MAG TPA: hypothetical protein [Caudoviricetes sp.]
MQERKCNLDTIRKLLLIPTLYFLIFMIIKIYPK